MHNQGGGQIMSPPSRHFAAKIIRVSRRRHLLRLNTTRYNAGQTCASGTDDIFFEMGHSYRLLISYNSHPLANHDVQQGEGEVLLDNLRTGVELEPNLDK